MRHLFFLSFFVCCALSIGSDPFSIEYLETFYDEFFCDEKNALSAAGITSACPTALCGSIPYPTTGGYATPDPILDSPQVWSFVSEPALHPMKITVNVNLPGTAPGFIFVAPYAFSADAMYGQSGALMMDSSGNPIWFRPLSSPNLMNTDFRVQTLNNQPVLTFWQGTLITPPAYTNGPAGSSEPGSCYYIFDETYTLLHTLSAQRGFTSDIHEFLLTPNNTALFLSTKTLPMDLTPYGGPENGFIQDFAIQEVDLRTNTLIFFWDAFQHIPLDASYEPASSAIASDNIWDVYHLNSIGLTDNPNEIIFSGRNTWTIYRLNKSTGNFVWQLGGKSSSFTIQSGAEFSWQHDARFLPPQRISLFDDNCCESSTIPPTTPYAHGLVLDLNLTTMTASMVASYYHDPNIHVASQGNVQTLSNGNTFVGFGESQYFSEYRAAGNTESDPSLNLLYDAAIPSTNYTYRAYRNTWVGTPSYPPRIAARSNLGQITVYASWNGSTETASWNLLAGPTANTLSLLTNAGKTGFETPILSPNNGPFFQVEALDSMGAVIGTSEILKKAD